MKYSKEEMEEYLKAAKAGGADNMMLMQLRFAFIFGIQGEAIELLADASMTPEKREWLRLSAMDDIPLSRLKEMAALEVEELKRARQDYLNPDSVPRQIEAEFGKIREEISKKDILEGFFESVIRQKDELIKAYKERAEKEGHRADEAEQKAEKAQARTEELLLRRTAVHCEEPLGQARMVSQEKASNQKQREKQPANKEPFLGKMKERLLQKNSPGKQLVRLLSSADYSTEQTEVIITAFEEGMNPRDIRRFARAGDPPEKMRQMKAFIQKEHTNLHQQKQNKGGYNHGSIAGTITGNPETEAGAGGEEPPV